MKANETRIDKFLASNETTFAIPVYQRNYDWTLVQCKQLIHDILQAGLNDDLPAHFVGSIVYVHDGVYSASGLTELTIIDGQQRLTTITLIYVALYRLAKRMGNQQLCARIQKTYLINEFAPEEEKLKLKPTDNNKAALRHILTADDEVEFEGYSRLDENYRYFRSVINAENLETIQRGLSKLIFVDIALDRHKDNPQRIFESLNSTGLELSQADLIRNYILMDLPRDAQERIFRTYWEEIEKYAKDELQNKSRVSDFIRDFLTLKNKEIPNKGEVYIKFKEKYPTSSIENLETTLAEIKSLVRFYNRLINPTKEAEPEIRRQLEFINGLEINVAYPFLMKVFEDHHKGVIDKDTFLAILELVQSYTFRRFMIGLPTNALNKIFMVLYDKVKPENYLGSVQSNLMEKTGSQRFPRDPEILAALKTKDMYNIRPKNRSYFFERIENFNNNERVNIDGNSALTIEHIFPQNPDAKWRLELGAEEMSKMKEQYLNTIGNLTLSGNNGKLGNKWFVEKRDMNEEGKEQGYAFSRLWLNRELKSLSKWGIEEIENRIDRISERFFQIWPLPQIEMPEVSEENEISIFDAEDPKHKKLEYAIFFNERLEVTQVAKLYSDVFKKLFELQPETFFSSELGKRIGLTRDPEGEGIRQAIPLNEFYCIEGNLDNVTKFERIKMALRIFDIEDELYIKYAD